MAPGTTFPVKELDQLIAAAAKNLPGALNNTHSTFRGIQPWPPFAVETPNALLQTAAAPAAAPISFDVYEFSKSTLPFSEGDRFYGVNTNDTTNQSSQIFTPGERFAAVALITAAIKGKEYEPGKPIYNTRSVNGDTLLIRNNANRRAGSIDSQIGRLDGSGKVMSCYSMTHSPGHKAIYLPSSSQSDTQNFDQLLSQVMTELNISLPK